MILRRFLFLFCVLLMGHSMQGQIAYDLKTAQAMALADNKLIIVDFWADWCGPCQTMEQQLWKSEEFAAMSDKFVLLKIDVDLNREMPTSYNVKGIPHVVVITADEDKLLSKTGFRSKEDYLLPLARFNADYSGVHEQITASWQYEEIPQEQYFLTAKEWQKLGFEAKDRINKVLYLQMSNKYLRLTDKSGDDELLAGKSELNQIWNIIDLGRKKKAVKRLAKLKINTDNAELLALRDFVRSTCDKSLAGQK